MLIIYTISGCHNCDRVKELLEHYDDKIIINCDNMIRLDRDSFKITMRNKIGFECKSFPMCFRGDIFIGGYNELVYHLTFGESWVEILNDCEF